MARIKTTRRRSKVRPVGPPSSPYQESGVSGLRHYGGRISEEWLRKLAGKAGLRVYQEMDDNDETLGACRLLLEMFIRNVPWSTTPYSDDPLHLEQAEYAESLRHDMEHSWEEFMSEVMDMIRDGFQLSEVVLKRRVGPDEVLPEFKSQHSDRRVGIRKLAPRAARSIERWDLKPDGTICGVVQAPPNGGGHIPIDYSKLLHFRTTSRLNNPEGRSIYRTLVISYHRKRDVGESEAIGINRDLAGLGRFRVPGRILAKGVSGDDAEELAHFEEMAENVHNGEMAAMILSSDRDDKGNLRYDFDLVNSGGARNFDTSAIVQRYDAKLAQGFLADFILLGHEQVGSFALASEKTNVFSVALGGWLNGIASVLNRKLMPLVFEQNGWPTNELPTWVPGDLDDEAIDKIASAVAALTTTGHLTPGDEKTENHFRRLVGMPELPESMDAPTRARPAPQLPPGAGPTVPPLPVTPGTEGGGRMPPPASTPKNARTRRPRSTGRR